jgi:hypothetical protein
LQEYLFEEDEDAGREQEVTSNLDLMKGENWDISTLMMMMMIVIMMRSAACCCPNWVICSHPDWGCARECHYDQWRYLLRDFRDDKRIN